MEANPVDVQFGKRFKAAREAKEWSLAETAKRLEQRGIRVYDSTLAKIEAGTRPIKLAELVAAANLFEVSIDTLLGRELEQRHNQAHVLMLVAGTAIKSSDHVHDAWVAIRDKVDDLSTLDDLPGRDILIAGLMRALSLLTDADSALAGVSQVARKNAGRALRARK
ncbi:MAG TPA: helix-turn-helix transcriptional regulator [Mycobacterium sp.]|nr:helix-turn-helix transcriptional regulator [Mycobacterium sp.]HTX96835.1 helix-turn-helix transcriptional regulator [Mycobacterium sp.]